MGIIANSNRFSIALIDFICLNIGYAALIELLPKNTHFGNYLMLSFVFNIVWLISTYATALYIHKQDNYANYFKRSLKAFFIFVSLTLLFIFIYHYNYSRLLVLTSLSGFFGVIVISRSVITAINFYNNQVSFQKHIAILGWNEVSERLAHSLADNNKNTKVHGCFKHTNENYRTNGTPILGNFEKVIEYSVTNNVQEIYSTISPQKNRTIYKIAEEAEKNFIRFKYVPDFTQFVDGKMHVRMEQGITVLSTRRDPLENDSNKMEKRLFDIIFSAFAILFILWWLIPIIALLIKLESKGPVFFKQLRTGKNNKPFVCYKFRSLKVNNKSDDVQVTKQDDRFTRIGKFLRKSNLDELPQFFNVLQNKMSVVGPRPHMLKHTNDWEKICESYNVRHYLKPGISGWAQINGFRGEINNNDLLFGRIEHDIWYMENWTMWLDAKIILLSVVKTFMGDKKAV